MSKDKVNVRVVLKLVDCNKMTFIDNEHILISEGDQIIKCNFTTGEREYTKLNSTVIDFTHDNKGFYAITNDTVYSQLYKGMTRCNSNYQIIHEKT